MMLSTRQFLSSLFAAPFGFKSSKESMVAKLKPMDFSIYENTIIKIPNFDNIVNSTNNNCSIYKNIMFNFIGLVNNFNYPFFTVLIPVKNNLLKKDGKKYLIKIITEDCSLISNIETNNFSERNILVEKIIQILKETNTPFEFIGEDYRASVIYSPVS